MSSTKVNSANNTDQHKGNKNHGEKSGSQNRDQQDQHSEHSKDTQHLINPERLQDNEHRMDERTNDVQGSVSYDQNIRKDTTDTSDEIERRWKDIEGDYRKRYDSLTDEDVKYKSDHFDDLVGRIAKRTNRSREEVNKEIRDWDSSTQNS